MLVIIITLVLSVLLTILAIMLMDECDFRECLGILCAAVAVLGYIAFGIMVIFAIAANVGTKGDIAANQ